MMKDRAAYSLKYVGVELVLCSKELYDNKETSHWESYQAVDERAAEREEPPPVVRRQTRQRARDPDDDEGHHGLP